MQSLKVGLVLLCSGTLDEKYSCRFLFLNMLNPCKSALAMLDLSRIAYTHNGHLNGCFYTIVIMFTTFLFLVTN